MMKRLDTLIAANYNQYDIADSKMFCIKEG